MVLGVLDNILLVDHDEGRKILPSVSDDHGVIDIGAELELILDVLRSDVFPRSRDKEVFLAIGDFEVSFFVEDAHIAGVEPSARQGMRCGPGILEVSPVFSGF